MKRKIIFGLLIIVLYILQCTIFQTFSLASISPNLLIILTSSVGFMRGKKEGLIVGFVSGFFIDIFFSDIIGFNALLYMYIGYINGFFSKVFFPEDVKLPMILIAASDFAFGNLLYFFLFFFRKRFEYGYYLTHNIIPEMVYTMVITVLLYQVILRINNYLEEQEKRGAGKFV